MFTFILINQEHTGRCLKEMEITHWTFLNGKSFLLQNRNNQKKTEGQLPQGENLYESIYLGVRQSYSFKRSKITAFLHDFSYI